MMRDSLELATSTNLIRGRNMSCTFEAVCRLSSVYGDALLPSILFITFLYAVALTIDHSNKRLMMVPLFLLILVRSIVYVKLLLGSLVIVCHMQECSKPYADGI